MKNFFLILFAVVAFAFPQKTQAAFKPAISLMAVRVEGLGKTLQEVYPTIDPAGPIRTYSIYCVSEWMAFESYRGFVEYRRMFYPAYFYGIGTWVSPETRCSLNVAGLRKQFVYGPKLYREIASGVPEFETLIYADQVRGFSKTNPNLVCRANKVGVFGVGYSELVYTKGIIRPYGVYMVYTSRDLICTTNQKVVESWKRTGWTEIPTPVSPGG